MAVVGIDIGGANLKVSDGERRSLSRPFALWQRPQDLAAELAQLFAEFPQTSAVALAMTGELADCFATKEQGVRQILSAVEQSAGGRGISVWQTGGEFCTVQEAVELVPIVAAANWHALATWVARMVPHGCGLLIDVGSTTTDVVPLVGGLPAPAGSIDRERMQMHELIYTGVRRTPLCAVVDSMPWNGGLCPVAAELFATTLDVYLLLGEIAENPADRSTANGRPATREAALDRIARMICCDRTEVSLDQAVQMAEYCATVQTSQLAAALAAVLDRLPCPPQVVVLGGEGEFLAHRALLQCRHRTGNDILRLSQMLGPEHSQAACAYALARLHRERRLT